MDRNGFGGDMTGSLVPTFGGRKDASAAKSRPTAIVLGEFWRRRGWRVI